MPTQKLYVGTDSEKGMWYNTVGKIVNQDDLGEDWIRVGNRITSELPSKLRFQDDLWTGKKKNGSAVSSTMLHATHWSISNLRCPVAVETTACVV